MEAAHPQKQPTDTLLPLGRNTWPARVHSSPTAAPKTGRQPRGAPRDCQRTRSLHPEESPPPREGASLTPAAARVSPGNMPGDGSQVKRSNAALARVHEAPGAASPQTGSKSGPTAAGGGGLPTAEGRLSGEKPGLGEAGGGHSASGQAPCPWAGRLPVTRTACVTSTVLYHKTNNKQPQTQDASPEAGRRPRPSGWLLWPRCSRVSPPGSSPVLHTPAQVLGCRPCPQHPGPAAGPLAVVQADEWAGQLRGSWPAGHVHPELSGRAGTAACTTPRQAPKPLLSQTVCAASAPPVWALLWPGPGPPGVPGPQVTSTPSADRLPGRGRWLPLSPVGSPGLSLSM